MSTPTLDALAAVCADQDVRLAMSDGDFALDYRAHDDDRWDEPDPETLARLIAESEAA